MRLVQFLMHNRSGLAGAILLGVFITLTLLGPIIYTTEPFKTNTPSRLQSPNDAEIFGTDNLGRDLLARTILGSRISLYISCLSVLFALMIGVPLGLLAGYFGGAIEELTMRVADILLAFPALILALLIVSAMGPGINNAILAIGTTEIPIFARIVRGAVLRVRRLDFVEAAHALGLGNIRILIHHILPNVRSIIIVQLTLSLAAAILTEAALSFLGLGAPPPYQSLGGLVQEGFPFIERAWWYPILPGIIVSISVLGSNLLGDGLRDLLDPRLRSVQ